MYAMQYLFNTIMRISVKNNGKMLNKTNKITNYENQTLFRLVLGDS